MKSVSETTTTILAKKLESFSQRLGMICDRFLFGMPSSDAMLSAKKKFFKSFSFQDDDLMKFMTRCAIFGSGNPKQSFNAFINAYPLTEKEKSDKNQTAFIKIVKDIDENNDMQVTSVKYFLERCLSSFIIELFNQSKENLDDFKYIVSKILGIYHDVSGDVTEFFEIHLYSLMKAYSKLFYLISKKRADIILTALDDEWKKIDEFTKIQKNCFFIVFSSIYIDCNNDTNILNQIKLESIRYFMSFDENSNDTLNNIVKYLSNIVIQIFPLNDEKDNIYNDLYQKVEERCNDSKQKNMSFKLLAILSNLMENPLDFCDFFKKYITPKMRVKELHSSLIESITSKLYFNHCSSIYEISKEHRCFEWKSPIPSQDYFPTILNWLKTYGKDFEKHQDKVAHLLKLLMIYDLNLFLETFVPELIDDPDLNKNYRFGFCNALRTFFANKNKILSLGTYNKEDFEKVNLLSIKICFSQLHENDLSLTSCACSYTTSSFTKSLISAIEKKEVALEKMILRIGETSYPIFNHSEKPKDISNLIANWTTEKNQEIPQVYKFVNLDEHIIDPIKSRSFDTEKYELLCLIALIKPNEELIRHICYAVLDSPKCGSLAIRVLQAIIHRFPSYSEQIISCICNMFLNNQISSVCIEVLLFALKLIVKASKFEGILFSEQIVNSLSFVLVVGLCSEKFYIRKLALDLINHIPANNNQLKNFIQDEIFNISKDAMRRAVKSTSQINKHELTVFPIISFYNVSSSNIPSLYIHYLSSFGKYLVKSISSKNLFQILYNIFIILCNILMRTGELDKSSRSKNDVFYFNNDFEFNAFSLLLSISEESVMKYNKLIPKNYFVNKIQIITQKILKQEKYFNSDKLVAMFSGLTSHLGAYVLPFLCAKKESYQRALSFTMNELLSDSSCNIPFNIIYIALHSGLISKISNVLFLDDFCSILNHEFRHIYESTEKKSLYMVETICIESKVLSPFSSEKWFEYLNNLETQKSIKALASWIKIFPVPDQHLQEFLQSLPNKSKIYPELYIVVFCRYYSLLKDYFIKESGINYSIFYAISSQVMTVNSDIKLIKSNNFEKSPILSFINENCGRLIALCLLYLSSSKREKRKEAMRFLKSIVYITMVYRKDIIGIEEVFKKIDEINNSISLSNVFISYQLNEILANYFQFCSEHVIYECFNISKKLRSKKLLNKENQDSNEIMKINKVNRCSFITNIAVKWLKSFSIDINNFGICSRCENAFKQFNIYSFFDNLLDLCDSQGMTKPIASILNIIVKKVSVHLILLCLYNLQDKSPEHQKSSLLFSLYLYARKPQEFLDEISQYLTVKLWYFNETQNIKKENLFNNVVLQDIKNKESTKSINEFTNIFNDYEKVGLFTIKILDICRAEDIAKIKPIESMILIYCLLFNQVYNEFTSVPLITYFTGIQPKSNLGNTTWNQDDVIQFIYENEKFLLEWGFCCGNLVVATTALTIFKMKGYVLPESAIEICLRTLHICSYSLNDKTDISKKKKESDEWIMEMLILEQKSQNGNKFEIAIKYIAIMLELLFDFIKKNNKYLQEIFSAGVSFCKCQNVEYQSIYQVCLSIIHYCLTNTNFNYKIPDENDSLITILMKPNINNYKFVEQIFQIISSLIIKNDVHLLFKKSSNWEAISGFILAPYFWTFVADSDLMKISEILASGPKEKELLSDILSQQSRDERKLIEYTSIIVKKVNEDELKLVLNFYSQIFNCSPFALKEPIYFILSEVIKDPIHTKLQNEISLLAFHALYDKGNINSNAYLTFLKNLSSIDNSIKEKSKSNVVLPFPLIHTYKGEINDWKPTKDVDIFSKYENFPPLCIIDDEFIGCNIFDLKSIVQKVNVVPFVDWYNELNKLITFNNDTDNSTNKQI